eukprot:6608205-Karenia_brevis.AAC.1
MSPFTLEQGFHQPCSSSHRLYTQVNFVTCGQGVYVKKRRLKLGSTKVPKHKIPWKSVTRQLVTKALSRKEISESPEAQAAI